MNGFPAPNVVIRFVKCPGKITEKLIEEMDEALYGSYRRLADEDPDLDAYELLIFGSLLYLEEDDTYAYYRSWSVINGAIPGGG